MNRLQTHLIIWLGSCMVAWIAWAHFSEDGKKSEQALASQDNERRELREKNWAREKSNREMSAHLSAVKRHEEETNELAAAAGGYPQFIVKNPDFSIAEMVKLLAVQCAPAGSRVTVRLDRFVEFEVQVILSQPANALELATFAKGILGSAAKYVYGVQFVYANQMVGSLDRMMIESITDWSKVQLGEVALLFLEQPAANPATVAEANDPSQPSAEANGSDELNVEQEAMKTFSKNLQYYYDKLIQYRNLAALATSYSVMSDRARLGAKLDELKTAENEFARTRRFFDNPDGEFKAYLQRLGIDPIKIGIYVRNFRNKQTSRLGPLLQTTVTAHDRMLEFLQTMDRQWSRWHVEPAGTQLRYTFQDEDARQVYMSANESLIAADQQFQRANNAFIGR